MPNCTYPKCNCPPPSERRYVTKCWKHPEETEKGFRSKDSELVSISSLIDIGSSSSSSSSSDYSSSSSGSGYSGGGGDFGGGGSSGNW